MTGPRRPGDLPSLLLEPVIARGDGDRPALRWRAGWWSYDELAGASGAAAAWLRERGVGAGDLVLVGLRDSPEWVALVLGASRIGAVAAPLSPEIPAARRVAAAARLGADAAVAERPDVRSARRVLPARELRQAIVAGIPDPGPAPVRPDDLAYLLLSSGHAGRPRWARHRAADLPSCVATYGRRVLRLRPDDVTWSVASLATGYGLTGLALPLGAGASAALSGAGRAPADCAGDCRGHGVTVLFGVPTSWARLARHVAEGRVPAARLAAVRMGVSAGEPLPASVWEAVHAALGLRLVDGLASSEASNVYLSARPGGARPGCVGWPVPGYRMRLRGSPDPDGGEVEGELLLQGPTMMDRYHAEAGVGPVDRRGWLATGDVVRRAPDGSYAFVRRMGDRFTAGGRWVDAARIASVLRGIPGVTDALVMAVPDAEGLLRVGAAIATPGPPDPGLEALIVARAAEHLPAHEVPDAVVTVPSFPTTPSGGVDRADLLRRLTGRLAEAVA